VRQVAGLLLLSLLFTMAACANPLAPSAGVDTTRVGEAAAGWRVFDEISTPACGSCHSLEPGRVIVGPSLAGIGAKAPYRTSDPPVPAAEFLQRSIIEPDADIAPGFAAKVMPTTYSTQLTEEQIADLVAFMLSLQ